MRRTHTVKCYNRRQLKTRVAGAGNAKRPSDGHLRNQEAATVDITPHRTHFVPPLVIPATICHALLPIEVAVR